MEGRTKLPCQVCFRFVAQLHTTHVSIHNRVILRLPSLPLILSFSSLLVAPQKGTDFDSRNGQVWVLWPGRSTTLTRLAAKEWKWLS